jgi:ADP-ribosylglycohydrolase
VELHAEGALQLAEGMASLMNTAPALARAQLSLEGLSVGDALGALYLIHYPNISPTSLPPSPWYWTDATHMAISIVETLQVCARIDPAFLARRLAARWQEQPYRGYGTRATEALAAIASGAHWQTASGSCGSGAALRAPPVGAYFASDPDWAAQEAQASALVTHDHPEGRAGAIAVAVAASIAASPSPPSGRQFLEQVCAFVPEGLTQSRLQAAAEIHGIADAAAALGSGQKGWAHDTVPFSLWVAAHYLHDFETAIWKALGAKGDTHALCSIVGGIVALSAPEIPALWRDRREPLPPL